MSSKNLSSHTSPLYRIPPYSYIHVLDQNTSLTRLETGPKIFFKQENEIILLGPEQMITLSPRHYCAIENPVVKDENDQAQLDRNGQVKLSHGSLDIRLGTDYKEPFPLYPGEVLKLVYNIFSLALFLSNKCEHSSSLPNRYNMLQLIQHYDYKLF